MKKIFTLLLVALFFWGCKKDKKPVNTVVKHTSTTFTISADSVILNPTGYAPLSALVHFKTTNAGHTEIRVVGKHGDTSDVKQKFIDNSTYHSIPVLGLYAGYDNTVEITVIDSKLDTAKSTVHITTGALPASMPNYIHVDVADRANMEPGFNLVSNFSQYPNPPQMPYMIDSYGDIRWYLDYTNSPQLSQLYYDCGIDRLMDGNFRFGDQATGKIYEVDAFGNIINSWYLNGDGFHHDIYEKPNGNFLVTVSKSGSTLTDGTPTIEDYVVEIGRASGEVVNTWDLKVSLDEYRRTLNSNPNDWMHENGLIYDASDNTIILSGRVQGVVKLTNDNKVVWILGAHRGWGKNRDGVDLNTKLLTPLDASGKAITDTSIVNGWTNSPDFEWNWYQHCPQLLPNGDLTLFDNGDIRNYNPGAAKYSRAVEFKINQANMTVQQVWAYGKERGTETYSRIVSSVYLLPLKNHILFSPGYQVPNSTGTGGKIVEVDYATKKVIFQMSISAASAFSHHRVQRMPLYPNGNLYNK